MVALAFAFFVLGSALDDTYLAAALKTAVWIRSEEQRPAAKTDAPDLSLYSGESGVLVFWCELAHATRNAMLKAEVQTRAKRLTEQSKGLKDFGLYTGLAGVAFAVDCAAKLTDDPKLAKEGMALTRRALDLAVAALNDPNQRAQLSNDIVSGLAGLGCQALREADLYAARFPKPTGAKQDGKSEDDELRDEARRIGDYLLTVAKNPTAVSQPSGAHLAWEMSPGYTREMPNFSHGTAGLAYFLAQLGVATKEPKYLDAAKKGAAYLMSLTGKDGLIWHHKPGGEDLDYLGWCHGPVGTARLFAALHKNTRERGYAKWIDRAAESLQKCGIPDKRAPGYWNNFGFCCGDAGMLRFFLDLYRLDGKPEQIGFAKRLADFLLAKAEPAGVGLKWTFAENRVSPNAVQAQTGLMQGAAGVGLALVWMHELEAKREALVRFPDAPWRW